MATSVVKHQPQTPSAEEITRRGNQHLAEIKARNALTVALNNESWGNKMTPLMRRAFAEFIRRFNLDVSEVDNLGGRPYRNGNYFKRRIAEMRTAGLVEWSDGEHIGPDERLQELADQNDEWAITENNRRLRERIKWAVPQDATHAYVTRVKLKSDEKPIEGCDWITPKRGHEVDEWVNRQRTGKKVFKLADPVGAAEPEKTVITRAWRRVGLLAAAEIPELKAQEEAMEIAAIAVEDEVERIGQEETARDEGAKFYQEPMASAPADDPYGTTAPAARTSAPLSDPVQQRSGGASADNGDADLPEDFFEGRDG